MVSKLRIIWKQDDGDAIHGQEELAQVRLPRAAQRRPRAHPARVASGAAGVEDGRDEDRASLGTGVAQSGVVRAYDNNIM